MPKTEMTGGADFLHKNLKDNNALAVWDGELYLEMHRGTFTTKSNLKKVNRALEFKLREAEMLSALKAWSGADYPAEELRECWKRLLLNQFHDILPGSHIHPVYEDAMADYAEIGARLDRLLAAEQGETWFNSLPFPRDSLTFIPDEAGSVTRDGGKGYWSLPDLPGLTAGKAEPAKGKAGWLRAEKKENGQWRAETPFYTLILNPDGSFASLFDRELNREWVKPGCGFNKLHLWADHPGMYDAWDILPNYKDVERELPLAEGLRQSAKDDVSAEFTVDFATEKSTWRMILRLFAEGREIEVEHLCDWQEKHTLAKVNFGPDVLTRELLCDTSAGFIRRSLTKNTSWEEARFEVCHHKWFDMSETDAGLAVINSGKYGVGLEGGEVSLSLLRSTIRPDITSDMGKHDLRYVILPHAGDAVTADVNRKAFAYNIPMVRANLEIPEAWRQALCGSGLWLQSLKMSEDGKMIVLRLSEQDGRRAAIHLPETVKLLNMLEDEEDEAREITIRPFEIVTIGIPR